MEAVIADEQLVERDRLRELCERSDGPGLRRLIAQTALFAGSAAGLLLVTRPAAIVALLLVNGVMNFAMFGMLHEACHNTAFSRRWLSNLAGWIAALA